MTEIYYKSIDTQIDLSKKIVLGTVTLREWKPKKWQSLKNKLSYHSSFKVTLIFCKMAVFNPPESFCTHAIIRRCM